METQKNEQVDVVKQLLDILEKQNMQEQSKDFTAVLNTVIEMQNQLGAMIEELHDVKSQLKEVQNNNPTVENWSLRDKLTQLEEKIQGLLWKMFDIKDQLLDTAAQAVTAFKDKGSQEFGKILVGGINEVKDMLSKYKEHVVEVKTEYEKTASTIDSIGDELKKLGNSAANVGRLLTGKEAQAVSENKQGVALTRIANVPIKNSISKLENTISKVDKACEKLSRTADSIQHGKPERAENTEKRTSVTEKLSEMKAQAHQQKKQPEKMKAPSRADCL